MKRMNKMLLVVALAATALSAQAEQKKGPAWLSDGHFSIRFIHLPIWILMAMVLVICRVSLPSWITSSSWV